MLPWGERDKGIPIMDFITLKRCKVYGYTGCLDFEKEKGQYFYVTCKLGISSIEGKLTDRLEDTIDYASIFEIIKDTVESSRFNLIEKLASEISFRVLKNDSRIEEVHVLVEKPDAPVDGDFDAMMVEISQTRSEICHKAVLSLGSNMGDRQENLQQAIDLLRGNKEIDKLRFASLYETQPVGYDDQTDFLNTCVEFETTLTPHELLLFTQSIEKTLHRVKTIVNGPRTIDLDILLYGTQRYDDNDLVIPHPRMYERAFVLRPLNELGLYEGEIPEDKYVRKIEESLI